MALFSMRIDQVRRAKGQSVVAAAAYRASEKLHENRRDVTHDYTRKAGLEHAEIMLPGDAPQWARELAQLGREALWNAVDAAEKRKDAQTAYNLRVMIPRELPLQDRITVVRDFVRRSYVAKGMIADVCWHNKLGSDGQDQPHAHILMSTRNLTSTGFGPKQRHDWVPDPGGGQHADGRPVMVESNPNSWNSAAYYERCREDWENTANAALARVGAVERIDRRSLLERGLSRLPEPALRLAFHLRELNGVMKERFGQFQMAKHYRAVEERAQSAFKKFEASPHLVGEHAQTANRFFGWIERQLERLGSRSTDVAREPSTGAEHTR